MNSPSTNSNLPLTLSVVMPAYNEEGCIESVLNIWLTYFKGLFADSFNLIVVNDGSRDKTGEILDRLAASNKQLVIVHQPNGGHGKALLHAYNEALKYGAEWTFHVDSDDQFIPEDFALLWNKRTESKFILGRRAKRFDAFHRLIITRILILINFLVFGVRLKDANIPYRLIKTEYLRELLLKLPSQVFAPNIFLSVLAAKDGQNLMEIPVTHRDRRTGKVSIVRWRLIKVCFQCVMELISFSRTVRNEG